MTARVEGIAHRNGYTDRGTEAMSNVPKLPGTSDPTDDELSQIYAFMCALSTLQEKSSRGQVENNNQARTNAEHARDEALRRAKDDGGLFTWLEKDMGVGSVIGLASFNYALVAADVAVHKLDLVDKMKLDVVDGAALASGSPEVIAFDAILRKSNLAPDDVKRALDKLGVGTSVPGIGDDDVKPVVDKALMANMMVAGAAASVLTAGSGAPLVIALIGLGISASASAVTAAGGPKELALGLMIAGAVTSGVSGFVGSAPAANAATNAAVAGAVIDGTTAGLRGTDQCVAAVNTRAAAKGSTDAERAKQVLTRLERLFDEIIDAVKDAKDSHRRTAETVSQTMRTHEDTMMMATTGMRG